MIMVVFIKALLILLSVKGLTNSCNTYIMQEWMPYQIHSGFFAVTVITSVVNDEEAYIFHSHKQHVSTECNN